MYTIEIDYTTGNSFNSEDITGERIALCWEDKELARAALKVIQEHYELYQEKQSCSWSSKRTRTNEQIFKEVKKKDWYRPNPNDSWAVKEDHWPYCCYVKMDDGQYRKMDAFWIGYFESLHEARVVCDEDDQDKVTFQ